MPTANRPCTAATRPEVTRRAPGRSSRPGADLAPLLGGSVGITRGRRTKASTAMGILMKKIHRHDNTSAPHCRRQGVDRVERSTAPGRGAPDLIDVITLDQDA